MKILHTDDFPVKEKTAVAVGLFDGVHAGHMELIRDINGQPGLKSAVYTFDAKLGAAAWVFTEAEKRAIFAKMQVDYYYARPFDAAFANRSPEDFLRKMTEELNAARLTVGFDFRFGKDAEGDVDFLARNERRFGYKLCVVNEVEMNGRKVSSRSLRALIANGDMEGAARLMGRMYFVDGTVEDGQHLGNKLGFPTANISTQKLLPSFGVYATITWVDGNLYRSVTNVGIKPTVKDDTVANIETFLLGFAGNLYGREVRVYFAQKLRDEIKFEGLDQLKAQIARDSAQALDMLKDLDVYKPFIL